MTTPPPSASPDQRRRATIALHGGREAGDLPPDAPVATPLVQSVTFAQPYGTAEGLRYAGLGRSPNAEVVQRRIAMLDSLERAATLHAA